ncbi:MAG: phosphoribosylformylglycinamidine cyclo-ligase [Acidobacteriota bacterium]|nr:phosphoribosylformylglycinamidine cyclo-ligase [Acidobacteriota bacterium]
MSKRERRSELTYRGAGVDIDAQDDALARIKKHLDSTRVPGVLSEIGSFGGLFEVPDDVERPVLVASTDGVGTKVLVAQRAGRHDTVGQDLVNHCVNDVLVMGARPLFFLDYLAVGKLDPAVAERLVAGVAKACRENRCALLGGETAEMPDIYEPGHYDLAGTIVGVAPRDALLDGRRVAAGDVLLGLASSGLHTNGYTLARRVAFDVLGLGPDDELPGCGRSVADELLQVHRSYFPSLEPLLGGDALHALSHITGGGITDNLPRVLPRGLDARIRLGSWSVPPVFETLRRAGGIPQDDLLRTFNVGIGMVTIVDVRAADEVASTLATRGESCTVIGEVVRAGEGGGRRVVYEGRLP